MIDVDHIPELTPAQWEERERRRREELTARLSLLKQNRGNSAPIGRRFQPVECFDGDGRIVKRFPSMTLAAEWCGGKYVAASIRMAITRQNRCNGYYWRKADDATPQRPASRTPRRKEVAA